MEITQKEFMKKLTVLANNNWKVKKLLSIEYGHGSYENLPQNIKDLIDKELNITRTEVMTITGNGHDLIELKRKES